MWHYLHSPVARHAAVRYAAISRYLLPAGRTAANLQQAVSVVSSPAASSSLNMLVVCPAHFYYSSSFLSYPDQLDENLWGHVAQVFTGEIPVFGHQQYRYHHIVGDSHQKLLFLATLTSELTFSHMGFPISVL